MRPFMARLLLAQRLEQEHQARQADYRNVKAALDEVKARRDLGYPALCKPLRRPHDG